MKNRHLARALTAGIVAAAVSGIVSLPATAAETVTIVDADASPQTRSLFAYLRDVRGDGILFGHQHTTSYGLTLATRDGTSSDVKSATGDLPAVFGWDTLIIQGDEAPGQQDNTAAQNVAMLADSIEEADAVGGINTLSSHMENFVTGGSFYDTTGDTLRAVLPGGAKNADLNAYLDTIALAAQSVHERRRRPHPDRLPAVARERRVLVLVGRRVRLPRRVPGALPVHGRVPAGRQGRAQPPLRVLARRRLRRQRRAVPAHVPRRRLRRRARLRHVRRHRLADVPRRARRRPRHDRRPRRRARARSPRSPSSASRAASAPAGTSPAQLVHQGARRDQGRPARQPQRVHADVGQLRRGPALRARCPATRCSRTSRRTRPTRSRYFAGDVTGAFDRDVTATPAKPLVHLVSPADSARVATSPTTIRVTVQGVDADASP